MTAAIATPADPVTPPQKHPILPISPTPTSLYYCASYGTEVSDDLLDSCAKLFSTNYGIWGENVPPPLSKFIKPGLCLFFFF